MRKLEDIYYIFVVILTLTFLVIHSFPIIPIDIVVDNTTIYFIVILLILPLIPRLKKIKWKDIEAEISSDEIKKVKMAVEKIEPKYPLPFDKRTVKGYDETEAKNLALYLTELVESDKILAVSTLRAELERVIRCIFIEINKIKKDNFASIGVFGMISFIQDNTSISKEVIENTYNIMSTCNKVLHGEKIKHKDAFSLVDSGNKILNYYHGYLFLTSSKSYEEKIKKIQEKKTG
jgi:hypothetical protein